MRGKTPVADQVSDVKRHTLGTRLVNTLGNFRYAQAGEDLKAGEPAYAHFEGELPRDAEGHIIIGQEVSERLWSDVRSEGGPPRRTRWERFEMGVPVVDVARGQFFWLKVKL